MSIGVKGWIDDGDNTLRLWAYELSDAHGIISRHYRRWQADNAKRYSGGGHIKKVLLVFDLLKSPIQVTEKFEKT